MLYDNFKSKYLLILFTFHKNVIFETIPLFSNCINIYILFQLIALHLKELDLRFPKCMTNSNDQIGQILSWQELVVSPLIKWFNKFSEYTSIPEYTNVEYTNIIPVKFNSKSVCVCVCVCVRGGGGEGGGCSNPRPTVMVSLGIPATPLNFRPSPKSKYHLEKLYFSFCPLFFFSLLFFN